MRHKIVIHSIVGSTVTALLFLFTLFLFSPLHASAEGKRITVAAAADLTYALNEIAAGFEKETGVKVVASYGSTGMLAAQIRAGAPFDAFFAADLAQMEALSRDGFVVPDSVELYGRGRIVLAVNRASKIEAKELKDLLKKEVRYVAIANPDHAPYGRAAREALQAAGVWEAVKAKLVYGENIRQALQYVQSGNAQAGIVALSVADAPEISYVPVEASLHAPLDQAMGVVKTTKEPGTAREFLRYVKGVEGRRILKKYGFQPAG